MKIKLTKPLPLLGTELATGSEIEVTEEFAIELATKGYIANNKPQPPKEIKTIKTK